MIFLVSANETLDNFESATLELRAIAKRNLSTGTSTYGATDKEERDITIISGTRWRIQQL